MYNFHYTDTSIHGIGAVEAELANSVAKLNMSEVLVVTDKILVEIGLAKTVTDILDSMDGVNYTVYDGTLPDNPSHIIYDAVAGLRDKNIDGLIGLGGGSSLDCAKAMNIMLTKGLDTLDETFTTRTGQFVNEKMMPLIAIPTTSGTGSEISPAAGIKDVSIPRKESIYGLAVIPDIAIVDAKMSAGMPKSVTLSTGLDAYSHCFEALFSKTRNNITRALGFEAIRMIVENLPKVMEDGSDLEARQQMADASTFSMKAGMHGGTHIGHGISHATGGKWYVPHGVATWHVLVHMPEYLQDCAPDTIERLLEIFGVEEYDSAEAGKVLGAAMEEFANKMGLPRLGSFEKVDTADMAEVVKMAQGFMAPRAGLLARELPSDEWVEKAILASM